MLDLRPVLYVVGLSVLALGAAMAAPALTDLANGSDNWRAFALSGAISVFFGGAVAGACRERRSAGLSRQQSFLLTTLVWLALPLFGALPFMLGAPGVGFTDAFFESMSGMTTTGSTVFTGLDTMDRGVLLWRGILHWIGGLGIIIFAVAFLPILGVGGMQLFRAESFDTMGKILPRAAEIAQSLGWIYLAITGLCLVAYAAAGMSVFDAAVHAMSTVSTGGFANYDSSFGGYGAGVEWAAIVFMVLSALPFIRFIQLVNGDAAPLWRDPQVRAFLAASAVACAALALYLVVAAEGMTDAPVRKSIFNVVSVMSGTGFASADYGLWGAFPMTLIFIVGFIGGCSGSTACSCKIFRYQVLIAAATTQVRRLNSPNGVFVTRFGGRPVDEETISSVMSFLYFFFVAFGVTAVLLSAIGLQPITAITGAATAIGNVGPGLGPEIGPSGNFAGLPPEAKWVLAAAMLIGRLELLAVFVLFTRAFWRR